MAVWRKDRRNYYKRTGGALGKRPTSRAERDAARGRGPADQAGLGMQELQSVATTQQGPQPASDVQTTSAAPSRKMNPWGATAAPSGYKPGANAPRFFSHQPTETKVDMAERRDELSRLWEKSEFSDLSKAPSSDQFAEAIAAAASHGTVEASQYGMYSGRTVQPPSSAGYARGFEPDGAGKLTDRQKDGVQRSVRAEVESRLEAKATGAAYTGAHSAAEQRQQNLDYQNGMVKRFGEDEARKRLGDRWVDTAPEDKPDAGADPASGDGSGPSANDEDEDYNSFHETQSDAKGGKTSAPGPVPDDTSVPPEPEEPQLVFGSRGEAAAALMSRGAEMDYPTFAQAAAIASLPGPGDGPDYDPDASFAELVTGRISDELLSLAERVEAYANAAPDERLYLQEKFMDSF